jgi:hypothetical protein
MKVPTVLATLLGSMSLALAIVSFALGATNPGSPGPTGPIAAGILVLILAFPVAGVLLAATRPGNPIGWLFLVMGIGFTLTFGAEEYAVRSLVLEPGSLPAGIWIAWIAQWSFVLWLSPLPLVLLLFPDGRIPSARWRPLFAYVVIWATANALASAFRPGRFGSAQLAAFSNPVGVEGLAPFGDIVTSGPLAGLAFLLCGLAAITRFRRSSALQRQQLKLFAYATGLIGVVVIALLLVQATADVFGIDTSGFGDALWIAFIASFGAIPIAVTVAILRYRLYDIDLLIKRTLVYGATSAAIAATFWVGIVALQAALHPLTSGTELAVAASTLASFALFQPVRQRIQDAVDRRFDRSRYDAARTLELFADRLRDEVDLDALRRELLGAVRETMSPAHASLWLREPAR